MGRNKFHIQVSFYKVPEETIKLLGQSNLYFFSPENSSFNPRLATTALNCVLTSQDTEVRSSGHKIMETLGFTVDKSKELEFVFEYEF
ncbi:unnamed protein product [Eruca vesicaria subsp. sativa]|uniref:Uncharacterized protein n=1 Tax=Eruca vesicaria subsp. sativa TaxID=29727 RepID=A0ABC8IYS2_ERUVS|nr:unnamed protein product [Eruca vesicaria subsp. sativa]